MAWGANDQVSSIVNRKVNSAGLVVSRTIRTDFSIKSTIDWNFPQVESDKNLASIRTSARVPQEKGVSAEMDVL